MNKGLFSSIGDWIIHPYYSEGTLLDYAAGLVLVLMAAFLWSTVVKQIE